MLFLINLNDQTYPIVSPFVLGIVKLQFCNLDMRTVSVIQKKASSEIEGKDGASEKTKSPRMNSWDRFVFVKTFSRISPQVENISSSKRENCRRGGYYAVRLGYCDIEI